jgi:hypothetical protein
LAKKRMKRRPRVRKVFRRGTKLIVGPVRDFTDIPVIFLDFDGVLNSVQHAYYLNREHLFKLDPYRDEMCRLAISNLTHLMTEVKGCKIVVSSTWRHATSINYLRFLLKTWKFKYYRRVVAKTPSSRKDIRGVEINWFRKKYKVNNYIIIDDDKDMMKGQLRRCVFTDGYHGLMFRDALKGIQILKGEKGEYPRNRI